MALDEHMSAELAEELAENNRKLIAPPVDPRTLPVRFSRLRMLARSAMHYWWACQSDRIDSLAMKLGRGVHHLVLDQEDLVVEFGPGMFNGKEYKGNRTGAYWDDFRKRNTGKEILSGAEMAKARAIAAAVRANGRAMEIITAPGTLLEHEVDWEHKGRRCQSHLDIYRRDVLVADLKGARDADPERFARTAIWSYYHAQLAFYAMAAEALGHRTPDAFLIVVENSPPYPVVVRPVGPNAMDAGRRIVEGWMTELRQYEEANTWPSYGQGADVPLELPPDAFGFFDTTDVEI